MIVNTMGRKWEFTFTTLVTFGGAFFASFPLFYATSFGGAYWVWIAILFSFIIQAVAYEFRSKPSNVFGQKTFDIFLFLNGSLGPFLIGTAVATFFTGAMFSLNKMNQVQWATPWYGLEALLNIRNLSLGFAVLFLARINGLLYIINSIDDDDLIKRSVKRLLLNAYLFLSSSFFLLSPFYFQKDLLLIRQQVSVTLEKYKYLHNFIQMPLVLIIFLDRSDRGIIMVLGSSLFRKSTKGIWFTGAGTILAVFSLFLVAGFNGTSFYPSILRSAEFIDNTECIFKPFHIEDNDVCFIYYPVCFCIYLVCMESNK